MCADYVKICVAHMPFIYNDISRHQAHDLTLENIQLIVSHRLNVPASECVLYWVDYDGDRLPLRTLDDFKYGEGMVTSGKELIKVFTIYARRKFTLPTTVACVQVPVLKMELTELKFAGFS